MKRMLVLAFTALLMCIKPALGQDTFDSIAGDWWFAFKGGTRGVVVLTFDPPSGGTFDVSGAGFARDVGEFFDVSDGQHLQFDSKGNITGTIQIEGVHDGEVLGTLQIETAKANKNKTRLKLKCILTTNDGPLSDINTRIKGPRVPDDPVVLTGESPESAKIERGGLSSSNYQVAVNEDPGGGFPIFELSGGGFVRVDGDKPDVAVEMYARLIIDQDGRVFGTFSSDGEPGDGLIENGTLKTSRVKGESTPWIQLKIKADRTFRLTATLRSPVSPRISVSPIGEGDFGTVTKGSFSTKVFTVTNKGVGLLSGAATIGKGTGAFAVESGSPYSLGPHESTAVKVVFQPNGAGDFEGTVEFTGGGGDSRTLKGKAVAGERDTGTPM